MFKKLYTCLQFWKKKKKQASFFLHALKTGLNICKYDQQKIA